MAESTSDDVPDSDIDSEYVGAVDHLTKLSQDRARAEIDSVQERARAEIESIKANTSSRTLMVWVIAVIFIGLNGVVMFFVYEAFLNDVAQMAATPPLKPEDRLITTEVVISLIGATVVQVGVAVIAIVSYLFPKQS